MVEQEINDNRYSFFDLFNFGKNNKTSDLLSIPKIQRDYAQGRVSNKASEIRKDFLEKLHEYMISPGIHDLDFVYGTTEDGKFIPLDGQQRLTTLFLIHWYLAKRCEHTSTAKDFFTSLTLESEGVKHCKFVYETRPSASEFSDALFSEDINLEELEATNALRAKENKTPLAISDLIKDKSWYIPDWKYDPTIQSMLVMIDAIDDELKGETDHERILARLMSENSPITFIFRNLDDYGLTDDLYIKMNSRGKPLTDFENFKAKFEQEVERLSSDSTFDALKEKIERGKTTSGIDSVKSYLSFNIDTKWTNLIWAYCHDELASAKAEDDAAKGEDTFTAQEKKLENLLDGKMSQLLKMVLSLAFAFYQQKEIPSELTSSDAISYKGLSSVGALTAQHIDYMIKVFDLFSNGMDRIRCVMSYSPQEKVYFDEDKVFSDVLNRNDLGFVMRTRLWAYIQYRLIFEDGSYDIGDSLKEWMKFVYNITTRFNGNDILNSNFFEALSDLNKFLMAMKEHKTYSIITALSSAQITAGKFFEDYQIKEEKIKAILSTSINFKKRICQLETHPYFNGQIGFILKLTGIWDIDETSPIDEFLKKANSLYEKFDMYGLIADAIFEGGYENRKLSGEAVFERALLTENKYYSDDSGNFLNTTSKEGNIQRDNSWKRYLRDFESNPWALNAVSKLFAKIYENSKPSTAEEVVAAMNTMINEYPGELTERSLLVKYSYIMKHSRNGLFSHYDGENLILHDWKSYSKYDWEVFTIALWFEGMCENKKLKSEFSAFEYHSLNCVREDDLPHIRAVIETEAGNVIFSIYAESCESHGKYYLWVDISEIDSESAISEKMAEIVKESGFKSENECDTRFSKGLSANGINFSATAKEAQSEYMALKEKINSKTPTHEQPAE